MRARDGRPVPRGRPGTERHLRPPNGVSGETAMGPWDVLAVGPEARRLRREGERPERGAEGPEPRAGQETTTWLTPSHRGS